MIIEEIIKGYEGFRSKPYKCTAGKLTIGYGRNLDDVGISKREAGIMLESDIRFAEIELDSIIDCKNIDGNRYHALVDLLFNMGKPTFLTFKKMIQAIKDEDWEKASDELLESRYANQVGVRATENAERLRGG